MSIFQKLVSTVVNAFGSASSSHENTNKDRILKLSKQHTAESITEIGGIINTTPNLIPYGFEQLAQLPSKTAPDIIHSTLSNHPEYLEQGFIAINQMPTGQLSSFTVDYAHQHPEHIPQVMAALSSMNDYGAYFAFQDLREEFPDHELIAILEFDNMQETWAQNRIKALKIIEQQGLITMDGDTLTGIKFKTLGDNKSKSEQDDLDTLGLDG